METPGNITSSAADTIELSPETSSEAPSFQFSAVSTLSSTRREHLENWHRSFFAAASGSLTDLLRLDLVLDLADVRIQHYGQMVEARDGDHHAILFRMHPQPGIWLLDMPLVLSHLVVERMTGGNPVESKEKPRSLTIVEQAVLREFADALLADYARNWLPHAELQAEIVRQERKFSPTLHKDDDLILLVDIRVTVKKANFVMRLMTPIASVEDFLMKSIAPLAEEKQVVHGRGGESALGLVPVPVSIRWQGFQITLREIDALAEGDVLILDNKKCESAAIWLGDRPKFAGRLVRDAHKTTITITGNLD